MTENMLMEEVEPYDSSEGVEETVGGKKHRRPSKRPRSLRRQKDTKKHGKKKHRKTNKHKKRAPSKWILHVKKYCKQTGKNYSQALIDPVCKKLFRN